MEIKKMLFFCPSCNHKALTEKIDLETGTKTHHCLSCGYLECWKETERQQPISA